MKEFGLWLVQSALAMGPAGLFLVALADSAFIPLPQGVDALVIAQTVQQPGSALPAALAATVGSLIGSFVLYWIARRLGRSALEKHVSAKGIERLEERTQTYGASALLVPMAVPLPLPTKIFVLAAGVFGLPPRAFLAVSAIGRLIRYGAEAWLAALYGDEAVHLVKDNLVGALIVITLVVVGFILFHRWSSRRVREGAW